MGRHEEMLRARYRAARARLKALEAAQNEANRRDRERWPEMRAHQATSAEFNTAALEFQVAAVALAEACAAA